jgi:thiamine-monophosphate kinase
MPADEFDVIRSLFAPLATHAGARGLADDAAVITVDGDLVVTTDAIVEGVHFRGDDPIETVAKKALRVNLSDLAAKGAKPAGALLTLIWPNQRPSDEMAAFARGLAEDLERYDVALWGGDTTATTGPLTVSITAFGLPLCERVPARADAKPGDDVWVTGSIGDAWLGFETLEGRWPDAAEACRTCAIARYQTPEPRVAFAEIVARYANASIDVSDGLAADAAKIATASGVALRIEAETIPLSEVARAWRAAHAGYGRLLDWGDDYEILFTAGREHRAAIETGALAVGVAAKRIGAVQAGAGARVLGADGAPMVLGGHAHRLGR